MDAADGDPRAAADAAWEQQRQQRAGAGEERRTQANGHQREQRATKRQFPLIGFRDIKVNGQRRYVVKNLIPSGGLIVVWGPPKCGKSFWVSDLALHVALGRAYRDRRVDPGAVVYITCEGQSGFPARIEAFRSRILQGDDQGLPFYLLPARLDLVDDINTLIADIAAQLGTTAPILIVVDTLNRSLAGSESKDEDMSAYIQACDQLREKINATVIVIHHCGVDGSRPRGHTALSGAVDAQIAVRRDKSGNIVATVEYMKDGPEGDEIVSRLVVVEVGSDDDGEPITSCVVEPVAARLKEAKPAARLPAAQKRALELLADAISRGGEIPPASDHIPTGVHCVSEALWRECCYQGTISDSSKPDAKQKAFKRAGDALLAAGRIGKWGELVWLVKP